MLFRSLRSSCEALGSLATWCTRATPTGGIEKETGSEYFHSYRGATGQEHRLRPDGGLSDYYVIMPIELFQMEQPRESQMFPLQFHLESSQFKNRSNVEIGKNGIEKVVSEYPELGDYMRKEIGKWASESVKHGDGIMSNKYIDFLNDFGGSAENYISKEDYDSLISFGFKKENIHRLNDSPSFSLLESNSYNAVFYFGNSSSLQEIILTS